MKLIFYLTITILIFTNVKRFLLIKENIPNLTLKTYFFGGAEGIWYSLDLMATIATFWLFYLYIKK